MGTGRGEVVQIYSSGVICSPESLIIGCDARRREETGEERRGERGEETWEVQLMVEGISVAILLGG